MWALPQSLKRPNKCQAPCRGLWPTAPLELPRHLLNNPRWQRPLTQCSLKGLKERNLCVLNTHPVDMQARHPSAEPMFTPVPSPAPLICQPKPSQGNETRACNFQMTHRPFPANRLPVRNWAKTRTYSLRSMTNRAGPSWFRWSCIGPPSCKSRTCIGPLDLMLRNFLVDVAHQGHSCPFPLELI